ncbi:hypothetical protein MBLNU457_g0106t1 [Dothideomycetes sp. NU457]
MSGPQSRLSPGRRPAPLRIRSAQPTAQDVRETDIDDFPGYSPSKGPLTRDLEALDMDSPLSRPQLIRKGSQHMSQLIIGRMKDGTNSNNGLISPPSTPPNRIASDPFIDDLETPSPRPKQQVFDFDLDQGDVIGSGLWSQVYRIKPAPQFDLNSPFFLTPPTTPQKTRTPSLPQLYAVKAASRPDAAAVFEEEANVLTHLQEFDDSSRYIIPFYGFAQNNTALVFEYASGGSLESFGEQLSSLSLITQLSYFRTLAKQLISGLDFLHSSHVIHADIKPANILLDFNSPDSPDLLTARFCDFSASLIHPDPPVSTPSTGGLPIPSSNTTSPTSAPPSRTNSTRKSLGQGGGTWTFMAPEQLSTNKDLSAPSYASDIYALSLTLLTFLLGNRSPFREMERHNMFMLREAIKVGDPFHFVRSDDELSSRLTTIEASQVGKSVVACLKLGARKKAEERIGAAEWAAWCIEAGW